MKKLLLILFFTVISLFSFSQVTLTIEINGLRNNNGQIHLKFYNEKEIEMRSVSQNLFVKKNTIVIENLKPGKYAFKYFHDENNNKEIDTNWIGMPTEGFGYSNNAKAIFGIPSFEKTIFVLKENSTLNCIITYY